MYGNGVADCRAHFSVMNTVSSFVEQGGRGCAELLHALKGESPARPVSARRHAAGGDNDDAGDNGADGERQKAADHPEGCDSPPWLIGGH